MKAMILAAGLGTRLRPLTLVRPKVLVPVMGTPVLDFWIGRLHQAGFEAVIVNAFHLHEALVVSIREKDWPLPVQVRVEPLLLDTGGGIRNVLDFFDDAPFAVVNGDILCDAPLDALYRAHLDSGSVASLLLHDCSPFNNVAVDRENRILGFGQEARNLAQQHSQISLLAFTGIHFLHPAVLKPLPVGEPESVLTAYRQLIREGNPPRALFVSNLFWREMGTLETYRDLNEELARLPQNALLPLQTGNPLCIHPEARIAPDAVLQGIVAVGKETRIMSGAHLRNVIVWDRAFVKEGSRLERCIVTDGAKVEGFHKNRIFDGRD